MTQEKPHRPTDGENDEFRRLRSEHQGYEQELETLRGTAPLSTDQQWRMSELKKLKLMAKDRMESIITGTVAPRRDEVPLRRRRRM